MNNPCFNCGYNWYDDDLGYETCHYEGPHEWSPCEAADEADRIERERQEWEEEMRQIEEEFTMKFKAKIICTIDADHPDKEFLPDWTPEKEISFDDIYKFTNNYSKKEAREYIMNDLMLVAGGGYNTKHIHNVKFEFEEVV